MPDKPQIPDLNPDAPEEAAAAPAQPPVPPRRGPGHRGADVRDTVAEMTEKAQQLSLEAGSKVAAAMKDVIHAAAGISGFAMESARDLVQYMVRRGQMRPEEADKLMREVEEAQGGKKPMPKIEPREPRPEARYEPPRSEPRIDFLPQRTVESRPAAKAAPAVKAAPAAKATPAKASARPAAKPTHKAAARSTAKSAGKSSAGRSARPAAKAAKSAKGKSAPAKKATKKR